MTPLKVAIVHSFYSSDTPSGENVMVEAQVAALAGAGFEVQLISANSDELSRSRLYPLRAAVNVATGTGISPMDELSVFKPDVVHVHNLFPNYSTGWLGDWNGPIVATLHNFRPVCAAGTLHRNGSPCHLCPDKGSHNAVIHRCYRGSALASLPLAIRTRRGADNDVLLKRADRILVLSARSRELYTRVGFSSPKLQVLENFVSPQNFTPNIPPRRDWVYLGRLTEEKGILKLLQYWPRGRKLSLYGDGPLRSAVESSGNPDIRYEGKISREDVPKVLADARGLIFPSIWAEGAVPLTYMEALAAGRPVVAVSGNAAADDICLSGSGKVFQNWAELNSALEQVDSDIGGYARRARQRYEDEFGVERWVRKVSDVYSSLL